MKLINDSDIDFWTLRDEMRTSKQAEKITKRYLARKIEQIATATFDTEIDGMDAKIEYFLWHYGICGLWNHPILGYVVTPLSIDGYDIRGIPNKWKPIINNKDGSIPISLPTLTLDEVIVFYDTLSPFISRKQALIWLDDYADVTETIRQQVFNQKTPLIALAGTRGIAEKLKRAIFDIKNNIKALVVDVEIKDKITPLEFNAPYNVESLYSYRKSIENEILEYCGIDNKDGFIKKERLVVDEQEGNDELLNNILNGCLKARQQAIDQLSRFGFTGHTKINGVVRPIQTNEDGINGDQQT